MKIIVCLRPTGTDPAHRLCNAVPLALAIPLAPTHQVIALLPDSVGAVTPLQLAIEAGVTRAVRLIDDQLQTSDFHSLGQLMANAIKRLGGDLILVGTPFDDEGVGTMSASLAKQLGVPHLARVEALTAGATETSVEATVRGGGRKRRLAVTMPAVLSVVAAPVSEAGVPAATRPPQEEPPSIETISLTDPEATVVRRRSEHLGRPEIPGRRLRTAGSARELLRMLEEPAI
jgi:electron transfer flavoprotein alpha/beta subunit